MNIFLDLGAFGIEKWIRFGWKHQKRHQTNFLETESGRSRPCWLIDSETCLLRLYMIITWEINTYSTLTARIRIAWCYMHPIRTVAPPSYQINPEQEEVTARKPAPARGSFA